MQVKVNSLSLLLEASNGVGILGGDADSRLFGLNHLCAPGEPPHSYGRLVVRENPVDVVEAMATVVDTNIHINVIIDKSLCFNNTSATTF